MRGARPKIVYAMKYQHVSIIFRATTIVIFAAMLSALTSRIARAELNPNGLPVPTTVVVTKPAPGQTFGNGDVVSFGVDGKTYKFSLKDGWVDDPRHLVIWSDVCQLVRQYKPNFNVAGPGRDTF